MPGTHYFLLRSELTRRDQVSRRTRKFVEEELLAVRPGHRVGGAVRRLVSAPVRPQPLWPSFTFRQRRQTPRSDSRPYKVRSPKRRLRLFLFPIEEGSMSPTDYVVVRAGSAGRLLANRLSQAGAHVLLVEAGPSDRQPEVKAPYAVPEPVPGPREIGTTYPSQSRRCSDGGCRSRAAGCSAGSVSMNQCSTPAGIAPTSTLGGRVPRSGWSCPGPTRAAPAPVAAAAPALAPRG